LTITILLDIQTYLFNGGRKIEVITTIDEMQKRADGWRQSGKTIVFVPTMGFLHEGHLALMRRGREYGDILVISIFVNPTQFGPQEDFETYPRDFERDRRLAESVGVDVIFAPQNDEMYGERFQTYVSLEELPQHLCGLSRPNHFRGVATIVSKLFNIVKPHVSIFGEKDYQQLVIIRQMVRDLNFDIRIVGAPTVREPDGLAMSSRNNYLSPEERRSASVLFQSLKLAQKSVAEGERDARKLINAASAHIKSVPHTQIDYVTICDPETLDDVDQIGGPVLMALAVKVGKTRLIDNTILKPKGN